MKLEGLSAVVTGGASGLGAAAAEALAAAGAKVAILDLNRDVGEALAAKIGGLFRHCDVTNEVTVESALASARAAHGVERVLVNCAGVAIGQRTVRRDRETGAIIPHSLAAFEKVIAVNLTGTFYMMTQCAAAMMTLPPMLPDGARGVIVNTASVAAQDGQIGQIAYAASKGGVAAMTLPAARDLAKDGIRVVAILPGLFDTPMFAGLPDEARQALSAGVPFPSRLGKPAEYGALVRHICENDMLNGECIRLDGAVRLAPR
ncbi:MAG: SDR family NAD(P)-dependent oxidoreductase [Hyphomicrobiales bacterium]|nr:SDR family NAD(P)-dependent oxidoreductase [Hyphomicrobiales bacterium]